MLESIYNIGGGKQQSPLARYLSSVSGAGRAVPGANATGGFGGQPPDERPSIDQSGGVTPPAASGAPPAFGPAGSAANQTPPALPGVSTDYSSDPTLQAMLGGSATDETDADAQALAARRSVLGQYGDKSLAESVLGAGDPTVGAIGDNPDTSTSTLARLKRGYATTQQATNESDNQNNISYGGHHVLNLANLAKDEQTQEADASTSVNDALNQIGATLASTKGTIRNTKIQAEQQAADRAAQAAILAALNGGGGGGGAGHLTPTPPADTAATAASGAAVGPNGVAGEGANLVDPGFNITDQAPIDIGGGYVYDPASGQVYLKGGAPNPNTAKPIL